MLATVLIFSVIVLAVSLYAIFRRLGSIGNEPELHLPAAPEFRSLFAPDDSALAQIQAESKLEAEALEAEAMIRRAGAGDFQVLTEAATGAKPAALNVLLQQHLVDFALAHGQTDALVSFIFEHDSVRVGTPVVAAELKLWQQHKTLSATARLLHIAARSDNAEEFFRVTSEVLQAVETGQAANLSMKDLLQLLESEFSLLSTSSRSSGTGILLKQRLVHLRRALIAR